MAGRVRKASASSSGGVAAMRAGSRCPSRRFSSSGPEKAFCTVTCWSSANPIRSALGSLAMSRFASGSGVKKSSAGALTVATTEV